MNSKHKDIELSIVATVFNDAEIVPILVEKIIAAANPLNIEYEIILVNDHSLDNSERAIEVECKKNPNVKGISLTRNHGQQLAMSAGLNYAKGNYIVAMDGDLQNPPEEIPNLYHEIKKGYDIVYTVSKDRNNYFNRLSSNLFWFILRRLFKVDLVKNQLMLRIINKNVLKKYNSYREINRSVEGIIRDISSNYSVIFTKNNKRTIGRSHYNFFKRFNLMLDMLISLTNHPLNMMIHIGLFILLMTVIFTIYYLIQFIVNDVPMGYTSLILSIFFFGSITIILLGIIGKYLSNIYTEVRKRPLFNVDKTFNL